MATFSVDQSGANISNFAIGDKIVINLEGANTSETLTYLDLVSPLADRLNKATAVGGLTGTNYASPMAVNAAGTGVDIRIPDFDGIGSTKLITVSSTTLTPAELLTRLSTHPEDFDIRSKGNTVVDWNDVTFDALKLAGFAPAASVRVFSMVQTAINDAVQGILNIGGRQTYLQTQGINVAAPAAGASADVAAAAAASRILTNIFSDPFTFSSNGGSVNPVFKPLNTQADQNLTTYYTNVFNAAVTSAEAQAGVSQASINAAVAYGNAVADQILAIRATDGFLRNADGSQVKPADFEPQYKNGIESAENLAGKDGSVSKLSDGTSLIGTGPQISAVSGNGTNLVTGVGASSPGVWRRAEDTLGNASYAGLASAEVASVNKTWVVPTTNFFSDRINPPPALDTVNYAANVAEEKTEASLLDIPLAAGTEVKVNNRTVTVNGVTTVIAGLTTLGIVANDTNTSESGYAGVVGADVPKIIAGASNGVDGIGTTSAERTIIAHVWANAEGGVGPNYAYQKVAQQVAINNNTSLADTALVFATLDQAFADGFENLWQEKWDVDYFWRPVSAIRNADQLASTASLDDNSWTPREGTPQHPCHPSGTSVSAGLAATILRNFYGDNQTFTVSADVNPVSARLAIALDPAGGTVNGTPLEEVSRTYTSFDQVLNETRLSRIYAGAHFRFATEHGVELGLAVGNYFNDNNAFVGPSTLAAVGTSGNDTLDGLKDFNGTKNIIFTGAGDDNVDLVSLATSITAGGNRLDAGSGKDTIYANKNDRLFGGDGDDTFDARDSKGGNRMSGGAGNDTFFLGQNDRALGGDGDDIFYAGSAAGGNLLSGGAGSDQFWIANGSLPTAFNTILDFQTGTDKIEISGAAALGITTSNLTLTQVGADTQIGFSGNILAVLTGIQASSLSTSNTSQFVLA